MNKKRTQVIVAVVLVAVMIYMWASQLGSRSTASAAAPAAAAPAMAAAGTAPAAGSTPALPTTETPDPGSKPPDPDILKLQRQQRALAWARDPFYALPPPPPPLPTFAWTTHTPATQATATAPTPAVQMTAKLSAILYSPARPLAVLDRRVLAVGDELDDGTRVVEITRRHVVVSKHGERFILSMEKDH